MFFREPSYFYLLLFVPVLLLVFIWNVYRQRKAERRFAEAPMLNKLRPEASLKRSVWRLFFVLIAIVSVILALARPVVKNELSSKSSSSEGFEAMVCVDISNSMLSQDVEPSRIEFTKKVVEKLLSKLAGNKVGVVVFAGGAFPYIPITTDLSSAAFMTQGISPDMLSEQGTDIAQAIELSLRSFSPNKNVGKAIVVLTDGENHQDNALKAAQKAAEEGVRIAVVGVGSANGGLIPIAGEGFLKDESGKPVVTKFNKDMCISLSQAGKGIFVTDTNPSTIVKSLTEFLDTLPKTAINGGEAANYQELYAIFVIFALLALCIEFFIMERKNRFFKKHKLF